MNKPFYIFFLLFLCFCCEIKSQINLVPNASFESYNACPNGLSQPTNQQLIFCNDWFIPNTATSDYFNNCAAMTSGVSASLNSLGYQMPFSGNAYCGILAYDSLGTNYKEYISVKLTTKLIALINYKLIFYISLSNYSTHAVKDIRGIFTQNQITQNNYNSIVASPNQNNVYHTDTLNWIKIESDYSAIGGEEYLTIGKFNDTTSTDILYLYNVTGATPYSYYYIDGVKLLDNITENICTENIPNVFTPNADSINDVLLFKTCSKILNTTLYNRWGNIVFNTEKQNYYWDGRTTSGETCIDGNYYYIIQTEEKTYKGFVQLVR